MTPARRADRPAFTFIEILLVVFVLAIAAAIIIPNIGSAADSQVVSAARIVQADLEVARSLAVTTQHPHSMVFSPDRRSYKVVADYDGGAYAAATAVAHPVNQGKQFEVALAALSGMDAVTVFAVNFGGQTYVTFQSLGGPAAAGSITLRAGDSEMVVSVEGLTGIVTVTRTRN
jgi:prepilin-type N-terminal cleavage/methylation domain-containing protein